MDRDGLRKSGARSPVFADARNVLSHSFWAWATTVCGDDAAEGTTQTPPGRSGSGMSTELVSLAAVYDFYVEARAFVTGRPAAPALPGLPS